MLKFSKFKIVFSVLPRKRDKDSNDAMAAPGTSLSSKMISTQAKPENFQLQAPIFLPNLPFTQIKLKAAI